MTTHFSDAFDQVGRAVEAARRFSEENAAEPGGVSVEAVSDDGAVEVTVTDAALTSIRLNPGWLRTATARTVEGSVQEAVNRALEEYQAAALAQFSATSPSFAQLQEVVADAQDRLQTAFTEHLSTTVARGEQQASRGYEGLNR